MTGIVPPRQPLDVYPGTHRPLGVAHPTQGHQGAGQTCWDEDPVYKKIQGSYREFFGISHLSTALGRAPKTIYKWEANGLFPGATWIYNSGSKNGRRRLYTRVQIEGAVRIAYEEGVLSGTQRFISQTQFSQRCRELFVATRAALPDPVQNWSS
ncbi:MerR family transcriptional regulator [Streptomyces malaysiensis]|uniref:hypothetical protein n=1 Tax=Streptomyces malaysiensis TaxID=92644 RepID=UPI00142EE6AF|nr:hypothetical protein [Streptomyces malaysiensis]